MFGSNFRNKLANAIIQKRGSSAPSAGPARAPTPVALPAGNTGVVPPQAQGRRMGPAPDGIGAGAGKAQLLRRRSAMM